MHPLGRAGKADYWVDIPGRQLHRYDPATGRDDAMPLAQEMGCFALAERGGFICGMRSGYARLDRFGGEFAAGQPDYDPARARFNDGRCDSAGRFWAGTMGAADRAGGIVYRLDADGRFGAQCNPVIIANGITFAPDGRGMTLADTTNHVLWAFDYDWPPARRPTAASCAATSPPAVARMAPARGRRRKCLCGIMAGGRVEKFHRRASCSP